MIRDEYKHLGMTSINNCALKYEECDEQKPYSALGINHQLCEVMVSKQIIDTTTYSTKPGFLNHFTA